MNLRLQEFQELLLVGGHTKHMPQYLLLLQDRSIYGDGFPTIGTSMDVNRLITILPHFTPLIPQICAGLINPNDVKSSSLIVDDLVYPLGLLFEQIWSDECAHELELGHGFGDPVATIPVA